MRQIMNNLSAMHNTGIVHRDVKPQNMILSPDGLRMIDLGAGADLRVGINYIPNEYLLDPRFAPPQQYVMSPLTPRCAALLPKRSCCFASCLLLPLHVPLLRRAHLARGPHVPPAGQSLAAVLCYSCGDSWASVQTCTMSCRAPPLPLAALLSPVLWRLNQPDRFDTYSAGIIFFQLCFPPLRNDSGLVAFNKRLEELDWDLAAWRASVERQNNRQFADGFKLLDADEGAGWELATRVRTLDRQPVRVAWVLTHASVCKEDAKRALARVSFACARVMIANLECFAGHTTCSVCVCAAARVRPLRPLLSEPGARAPLALIGQPRHSAHHARLQGRARIARQRRRPRHRHQGVHEHARQPVRGGAVQRAERV